MIGPWARGGPFCSSIFPRLGITRNPNRVMDPLKGGVAAGCLYDFDDICALAGSTSISCAGSRSFHYGIASSPVDPMLFERCFAPWVVQATSPRSLARQKTQEKRQNAPKARKPGRSCLKPPAQNRPGFLAVKGSRGRLISCSCRRLKGRMLPARVRWARGMFGGRLRQGRKGRSGRLPPFTTCSYLRAGRRAAALPGPP